MSEKHSVSVALLLENGLERDYRFWAGGLLLVQKQDSALWGLIAGHLKKESALDGVYRELKEETGLQPAEVHIQSRPDLLTVLGETKTSVGIVYRGKTHRPVPNEGYRPQSEEISLVKPHSVKELVALIASPEKIYKPEFNLVFLSKALIDYIAEIKYPYDDKQFHTTVARAWGIDERFIEEYL